MRVTTPGPTKQQQRKSRAASADLIKLLALSLLLLLLTIAVHGALPPQDEPRQPLGSLTRVGDVYVNDSPAPTESTIFSGDTLRTGDNGTATFVMSGKGTLKIAPRSEVVFAGSYLFTAELHEGIAVLSSPANGIVLRVGNYVLIPSFQDQTATSKVEANPDSSFHVFCLQGSVGVLTIEGKSGELLHAGQSMNISPKTMLSPILGRPRRTGQILRPTWVILGAAGVGALVAFASTQGGGKTSVSPSAP